MSKKVYAFLADGFETVECLAVVDILRRGGMDVSLVSVMGRKDVLSSQKVTVIADVLMEETDASDADCLFLPGGMPGTTNLGSCKKLTDLLMKASEDGRTVISAICAAPSVLGQLGILAGRVCTCYPGFEDRLLEAEYRPDGVVRDGNIITGRGMGCSVDLGLELLAALDSPAAAEKVKASIQHPDTIHI